MAIPVLAGIPWLAGLVGGLFSSLFTFFTSYLTKRLAITAAAVTLIVGVTGAFFAALQALVAALILTLPSELTAGASLILPANTSLCLSIIISAHLLRFGYDWSIRIIQYKLF